GALVVLGSLGLATVLTGQSAQARRAQPTPSSVYEQSRTTRLRIDASSTAARGPADAPLTLVIFAEFQDPFIARAQATLEQVRQRYGADVRMVFRHRPLDFHTDSRAAARAALEALAQGGPTWFWAMHDRLLGLQRVLDDASLLTLARDLGLDEQRFREALVDGRHDAVIAADEAEAARVGATGSPTFFVNGVKIAGAQPFEVFERVLDAELALATQAMQLGAARGDIYRLAMAVAVESDAPPTPTPPAGADAAGTPGDVFRVPVARGEPVRGGRDALVTIVMFGDFQCPFCARALVTLAALEQRYGRDLRIVFRHLPLPFHQDAMPAAQASVEAYAQRGDAGFWAMHDLLYANPRSLTRTDLDGYARQLRLDMRRFQRALDNGTHRARVEADMAAAHALGVSATPNFFINGRLLTGAQPEEAFVRLIDAGLVDARAELQRGTPRAQVYGRLVQNGRTAPSPPAPRAAAAVARPTLDPEAVYRVPVTVEHPTLGRSDALVTVVVFTDFECPFCARLVPTLEAIRQRYGRDVRVVVRNNPLAFHTHATLAAEAALEAFVQGGQITFRRFHDLLFANQRALDRANLEAYAHQSGLDLPRFQRALDNHTHLAAVQADAALANALGATGTPSTFINGKNVRGAQPLEVFQARIDTELAAAQALVRQGVPRARVYEHIIRNGATAPVYLPAPTP
ncbi:MAG: thioredoxin domain-containing protein, partial [Myxococcales bacterium]|nr:thioredoxin domain-containing protein [Myxococcales bacterium]